jgi:hypothetical protein
MLNAGTFSDRVQNSKSFMRLNLDWNIPIFRIGSSLMYLHGYN